jgi:NTE family protein
MAVAARTHADLVLSGGGVKGVGLAGAAAALIDAGYLPQRVSGTSAGSIVGAVVAAASKRADVTGEQVKEIALGINYRKFLDPGRIERVPLFGPAVAMVRGNGIYRGDYAHEWIRRELKNLGVNTFGDLALDDDTLPEERRYKLVVTVADLTRGQLVRLPWDYRRVYGRDPDEQSVAHAVRASMASLDRTDGRRPRWPTFGITVMPNLSAGGDAVTRALAVLRVGAPPLLERVITTMMFGRDQAYLDQPWVSARIIQVQSSGLSVLDFGASTSEIEALYAKGYAAAQHFLAGWDWHAYRDRFR